MNHSYPRPPFDLDQELVKIQNYTNLPITNIVFRDPADEFDTDMLSEQVPTETADLYIGDTNIGTINYIILPGVIG